jgi:transposase
MTMLAENHEAVTGCIIGVDTHTDTHTACLIDYTGREIGLCTFEAAPDGYMALLTWAGEHAHGPVLWAVEGTRSHGTGLVRVLIAAGQQVVEAGRPTRPSRRPGGKSDPADARLAARATLSRTHHAQPRSDGDREALRILLLAREHANTTRTAAINMFKALLLTVPDTLREPLRRLSTPRQTAACATLRVLARHSPAELVLRETLRSLARQIRLLDKEIRANQRQLRDLVAAMNPGLLAEPGVGAVSAAHLIIAWSHPGRCRSEAAFAALAGVSPIEASSGRITRHRLNRFGDRKLNCALHTIVNWRMLHDHEPTQHYLERRRAQQKTDAEIRRCLKRYTARHLLRLMENSSNDVTTTEFPGGVSSGQTILPTVRLVRRWRICAIVAPWSWTWRHLGLWSRAELPTGFASAWLGRSFLSWPITARPSSKRGSNRQPGLATSWSGSPARPNSPQSERPTIGW